MGIILQMEAEEVKIILRTTRILRVSLIPTATMRMGIVMLMTLMMILLQQMRMRIQTWVRKRFRIYSP